jgi:hypothetical protein
MSAITPIADKYGSGWMSTRGALSGFAEGAVGRELLFDVRFTPESGHVRRNTSCPLCANSGHGPI